MTRINLVDPSLLTDQHLMAEYRELPMVHAALRRSMNSKNWKNLNIPERFTLNAGHVKFFYNKGKFLEDRYHKLMGELVSRGYNITPEDRGVDFDIFKLNNLYGDFSPSEDEVQTSVDRILLRVSQKEGWYKLHKMPIPLDKYKKLIEDNIHVATKRQNQS